MRKYTIPLIIIILSLLTVFFAYRTYNAGIVYQQTDTLLETVKECYGEMQKDIDQWLDNMNANDPCKIKSYYNAFRRIRNQADTIDLFIQHFQQNHRHVSEDTLQEAVAELLNRCVFVYDSLEIPARTKYKEKFLISDTYKRLSGFSDKGKDILLDSALFYDLLRMSVAQVCYQSTRMILSSIGSDDFRFDTVWVATMPAKFVIQQQELYKADLSVVSNIRSGIHCPKSDYAVAGRAFDTTEQKFTEAPDTFYFGKRSIPLKLKPYQTGTNTYWVQYHVARYNCKGGYEYKKYLHKVEFHVIN